MSTNTHSNSVEHLPPVTAQHCYDRLVSHFPDLEVPNVLKEILEAYFDADLKGDTEKKKKAVQDLKSFQKKSKEEFKEGFTPLLSHLTNNKVDFKQEPMTKWVEENRSQFSEALSPEDTQVMEAIQKAPDFEVESKSHEEGKETFEEVRAVGLDLADDTTDSTDSEKREGEESENKVEESPQEDLMVEVEEVPVSNTQEMDAIKPEEELEEVTEKTNDDSESEGSEDEIQTDGPEEERDSSAEDQVEEKAQEKLAPPNQMAAEVSQPTITLTQEQLQAIIDQATSSAVSSALAEVVPQLVQRVAKETRQETLAALDDKFSGFDTLMNRAGELVEKLEERASAFTVSDEELSAMKSANQKMVEMSREGESVLAGIRRNGIKVTALSEGLKSQVEQIGAKAAEWTENANTRFEGMEATVADMETRVTEFTEVSATDFSNMEERMNTASTQLTQKVGDELNRIAEKKKRDFADLSQQVSSSMAEFRQAESTKMEEWRGSVVAQLSELINSKLDPLNQMVSSVGELTSKLNSIAGFMEQIKTSFEEVYKKMSDAADSLDQRSKEDSKLIQQFVERVKGLNEEMNKKMVEQGKSLLAQRDMIRENTHKCSQIADSITKLRQWMEAREGDRRGREELFDAQVKATVTNLDQVIVALSTQYLEFNTALEILVNGFEPLEQQLINITTIFSDALVDLKGEAKELLKEEVGGISNKKFEVFQLLNESLGELNGLMETFKKDNSDLLTLPDLLNLILEQMKSLEFGSVSVPERLNDHVGKNPNETNLHLSTVSSEELLPPEESVNGDQDGKMEEELIVLKNPTRPQLEPLDPMPSQSLDLGESLSDQVAELRNAESIPGVDTGIPVLKTGDLVKRNSQVFLQGDMSDFEGGSGSTSTQKPAGQFPAFPGQVTTMDSYDLGQEGDSLPNIEELPEEEWPNLGGQVPLHELGLDEESDPTKSQLIRSIKEDFPNDPAATDWMTKGVTGEFDDYKAPESDESDKESK